MKKGRKDAGELRLGRMGGRRAGEGRAGGEMQLGRKGGRRIGEGRAGQGEEREAEGWEWQGRRGKIIGRPGRAWKDRNENGRVVKIRVLWCWRF